MIVKIKLDDWAKKNLKSRIGFKVLGGGADSLSPQANLLGKKILYIMDVVGDDTDAMRKISGLSADSLSANDLLILSLIQKEDGDTMDLTEEAGKLGKLLDKHS